LASVKERKLRATTAEANNAGVLNLMVAVVLQLVVSMREEMMRGAKVFIHVAR
jgi:hypothetical protein